MSDSKVEFSSEYLPSEYDLKEEAELDWSFVDDLLNYCEEDLNEKNRQRYKSLLK